MRFVVMFFALCLFSLPQASATLCKKMTSGPNTIAIFNPAPPSSGPSFWLWPERNAIRFEAGDLAAGPKPSWLSAKVVDSNGTTNYLTTSFYVYGVDQEDYLRCIDLAVKASQKRRAFSVLITNVVAGFYDYPKCEGKAAWAAFPADSSPEAETFTKMRCELVNE